MRISYLQTKGLFTSPAVLNQQLKSIFVFLLIFIVIILNFLPDVLLNFGMNEIACSQTLPNKLQVVIFSSLFHNTDNASSDCHSTVTHPVQATEGNINWQGEQVFNHFLKCFHQFLLICLDLLRLETKKDSHGYTKHESFHLWVNQHTWISLQPVLNGTLHLLLDNWDVVLKSIS